MNPATTAAATAAAAAALFDTITRALDAEDPEDREAAIEAFIVLACRPEQGAIAIASRQVLASRAGVYVKWRGPKIGWEIRGRMLGT